MASSWDCVYCSCENDADAAACMACNAPRDAPPPSDGGIREEYRFGGNWAENRAAEGPTTMQEALHQFGAQRRESAAHGAFAGHASPLLEAKRARSPLKTVTVAGAAGHAASPVRRRASFAAAGGLQQRAGVVRPPVSAASPRRARKRPHPGAGPAAVGILSRPVGAGFGRPSGAGGNGFTGASAATGAATGAGFAGARAALRGRGVPPLDLAAARTWVYPTNMPIRDYQLSIARAALLQNTLVCLPTGLGKTLIAAVVMYNYYRWFPGGKVVFLAPTKPLVAQQIEACHRITGIPQSETAELQGSVRPEVRAHLWQSRRVFFCTPQSILNDLRRGAVTAESVVCMVVDEAHKATGSYAYVTLVQEIERATPRFRVLALSATPGATMQTVQTVVSNMRVQRIEMRTEDDADVRQYMHARLQEVVRVKLGQAVDGLKRELQELMVLPATRLAGAGLTQDRRGTTLSKMQLLEMRTRLMQEPPQQIGFDQQRIGQAFGDIGLLMSLQHARSLLLTHGVASFHSCLMRFRQEATAGARPNPGKAQIVSHPAFQKLLARTKPGKKGGVGKSAARHPKIEKLVELLRDHFARAERAGSPTRAIVFTQFRESVHELVVALAQLYPLVKARAFVGQGKGAGAGAGDAVAAQDSEAGQDGDAGGDGDGGGDAEATSPPREPATLGVSSPGEARRGQTQKEQQAAVRAFRAGKFNTLVATCIGEEGLDIGEVDLIVSFDALTSPVRMIQRMGRTGRKRAGRIVILVTEGAEERKLRQSRDRHKTVVQALRRSASTLQFYVPEESVLPPGAPEPEMEQRELVIPEYRSSQVGGRQQQRHSKGTLTRRSEPTARAGGAATTGQLDYLQENYELSQGAHDEVAQVAGGPALDLAKWLTFQSVPTATHGVGHSSRTAALTGVLDYLYERRWEADGTYTALASGGVLTDDPASDGAQAGVGAARAAAASSFAVHWHAAVRAGVARRRATPVGPHPPVTGGAEAKPSRAVAAPVSPPRMPASPVRNRSAGPSFGWLHTVSDDDEEEEEGMEGGEGGGGEGAIGPGARSGVVAAPQALLEPPPRQGLGAPALSRRSGGARGPEGNGSDSGPVHGAGSGGGPVHGAGGVSDDDDFLDEGDLAMLDELEAAATRGTAMVDSTQAAGGVQSMLDGRSSPRTRNSDPSRCSLHAASQGGPRSPPPFGEGQAPLAMSSATASARARTADVAARGGRGFAADAGGRGTATAKATPPRHGVSARTADAVAFGAAVATTTPPHTQSRWPPSGGRPWSPGPVGAAAQPKRTGAVPVACADGVGGRGGGGGSGISGVAVVTDGADGARAGTSSAAALPSYTPERASAGTHAGGDAAFGRGAESGGIGGGIGGIGGGEGGDETGDEEEASHFPTPQDKWVWCAPVPKALPVRSLHRVLSGDLAWFGVDEGLPALRAALEWIGASSKLWGTVHRVGSAVAAAAAPTAAAVAGAGAEVPVAQGARSPPRPDSRAEGPSAPAQLAGATEGAAAVGGQRSVDSFWRPVERAQPLEDHPLAQFGDMASAGGAVPSRATIAGDDGPRTDPTTVSAATPLAPAHTSPCGGGAPTGPPPPAPCPSGGAALVPRLPAETRHLASLGLLDDVLLDHGEALAERALAWIGEQSAAWREAVDERGAAPLREWAGVFEAEGRARREADALARASRGFGLPNAPLASGRGQGDARVADRSGARGGSEAGRGGGGGGGDGLTASQAEALDDVFGSAAQATGAGARSPPSQRCCGGSGSGGCEGVGRVAPGDGKARGPASRSGSPLSVFRGAGSGPASVFGEGAPRGRLGFRGRRAEVTSGQSAGSPCGAPQTPPGGDEDDFDAILAEAMGGASEGEGGSAGGEWRGGGGAAALDAAPGVGRSTEMTGQAQRSGVEPPGEVAVAPAAGGRYAALLDETSREAMPPPPQAAASAERRRHPQGRRRVVESSGEGESSPSPDGRGPQPVPPPWAGVRTRRGRRWGVVDEEDGEEGEEAEGGRRRDERSATDAVLDLSGDAEEEDGDGDFVGVGGGGRGPAPALAARGAAEVAPSRANCGGRGRSAAKRAGSRGLAAFYEVEAEESEGECEEEEGGGRGRAGGGRRKRARRRGRCGSEDLEDDEDGLGASDADSEGNLRGFIGDGDTQSSQGSAAGSVGDVAIGGSASQTPKRRRRGDDAAMGAVYFRSLLTPPQMARAGGTGGSVAALSLPQRGFAGGMASALAQSRAERGSAQPRADSEAAARRRRRVAMPVVEATMRHMRGRAGELAGEADEEGVVGSGSDLGGGGGCPGTQVHDGVRCDGCGQEPLRGNRHACLTCGDYDLCEACQVDWEELHPHPDHEFVVLERPEQAELLSPQEQGAAAAAAAVATATATATQQSTRSVHMSRDAIERALSGADEDEEEAFERSLRPAPAAGADPGGAGTGAGPPTAQRNPQAGTPALQPRQGDGGGHRAARPAPIAHGAGAAPLTPQPPRGEAGLAPARLEDVGAWSARQRSEAGAVPVVLSARLITHGLCARLRARERLAPRVLRVRMQREDLVLSTCCAVRRTDEAELSRNAGGVAGSLRALTADYTRVVLLVCADPSSLGVARRKNPKIWKLLRSVSATRGVCVVTAPTPEQEAAIIAQLAWREAAAGFALPRDLLDAMCGSEAAAAGGAGPPKGGGNDEALQHCLSALQALVELPGVGIGVALALVASFRGRSLAAMANASPPLLLKAVPGLSPRRAALLRQAFIRS